ncbi:MAG: FmdE family protein [Chloroflexota bacterium]|nr:FmdE family protein [Chloroflexota bacterium]
MEDKFVQNPRYAIEDAIKARDLPKLLAKAGELHGHFCPFLALGVKAAVQAVNELGVNSTGMEEVIAIVETNNCFSDGVQFVTGCSFGNNALIYRDYGKTAFTLAKRNGEAVRVSVKDISRLLEEREPEAQHLFQKVVVNRQGTNEEQQRLREAWRQIAFEILDISDEDLFNVQRMTIQVPAYSRIFASVKCAVCGENVMETRTRVKNGTSVCIPCSGQEYNQLAGDGISLARKEN